MNEQLRIALAAIAHERGARFNDAFRAAQELVDSYGEENLAERVVSEAPHDTQWELLADLLGILQWSTSDNGAAITRQAERWLLEARDLRRVRIALSLDTYPFGSKEEMEHVLKQVSLKLPAVAARCEELIRSRTREAG